MVKYLHTVRGNQMAGPVKVILADIQRIPPTIPGNGIHDALHRQHALRPAEPPERGVRDRVVFNRREAMREAGRK